MNLLLLIVIAITALLAILGYRRGLFKSAVSTVGIVLAVFLTTILHAPINKAICNNTGLDEYIKSKIEEKFELDTDKNELTRNEEMELLENIPLPENIKEWIIENGSKETFGKLNAKGFEDYVAIYLTEMVMKGLSYLITFIVLMIIINIFINLADVITSIPILNGLNKVGGILFGICQSLIIIWIAFIIITFLSAFDWGMDIMKMIDESSILSIIYEKNIFLKFVVDILGKV